MSTDVYRYKAICTNCQHEGVEIRRENGWGETDLSWEGFSSEPSNPYEVYRQRGYPFRPICNCGNKDIRTERLPIAV